MSRSIYFCKSWFRAKKKPTEVWSEERARLAHASKQTYTVLVDSIERPYCFLDVSDGVVGVGFFDDSLRESLTYAFQEVEAGRLFLTMATYRQFDGNTDRVLNGTTYFFEQDGTVKISEESFDPPRQENREVKADVQANYSPVPEFGRYDDLIRVERT